MQEVVSPPPPPLPRRRLPVKASSGRITMQVSSPRGSSGTTTCMGEDESMQDVPAPSLDVPSTAAARSPVSPTSTPQSTVGTTEPASTAAEAHQQRAQNAAQSMPSCSPSSHDSPPRSGSPRCCEPAAAAASASACSTSTSSPPRPAPALGRRPLPPSRAKPPPLLATGPLNSSSTPHVVALPVKRRGSYQSLKRHAVPASSNDSEGQPSILSLLKKATHWERFGTILVLGCLSTDRASPVMQTLLAEGYDTSTAATHAEAVEAFSTAEVFPDVVLIDCDLPVFASTLLQLISHLQSQNPAVAIICLASQGSKLDAVTALQAGAADYMHQPLDLAELVARIERHVQRQHCIKLELETAMEGARNLMAQLSTANANGLEEAVAAVAGRDGSNSAAARALGRQQSGPDRLNAVAETDFEQQIMDLSEENQRLGSKLSELEERLERKVHENCQLADKLNELQVRLCAETRGVQGQLNMVAQQNSTIITKVDAIAERIKRCSQDHGQASWEAAQSLEG